MIQLIKIKCDDMLSNAQTEHNLGVMYLLGEGVSQDYKKALYWFEKASDQGLAGAQYNLGAMYYSGQGVSQDYQKALYWFEKASDQGLAEAQCILESLYESGYGGIKKE